MSLTITTTYDSHAAAGLGLAREGECRIVLTDVDIAPLAPPVRSVLADWACARTSHRPLLAAGTVEELVARAAERAAEMAAAEARHVAEFEEAVAYVLAAPVEALLYRECTSLRESLALPSGRSVLIPWSDPRLAAQHDAARALRAVRIAEAEAEIAAERAARDERERARKAGIAAREATFRADAERWIGEHGSARLRRIVSEGFLADSVAVYRDERLAVERPGWQWLERGDGVGDDFEPRNPDLGAFALLDAARAVDSAATLRRWIRHVDATSEYDDDGEHEERWCCTAIFLGRDVVLFGEVEP